MAATAMHTCRGIAEILKITLNPIGPRMASVIALGATGGGVHKARVEVGLMGR